MTVFSCEDCPRSFSTAAYRMQHCVSKEHMLQALSLTSNGNAAVPRCDSCPRAFRNFASLLQHLQQTGHGEYRVPRETAPAASCSTGAERSRAPHIRQANRGAIQMVKMQHSPEQMLATRPPIEVNEAVTAQRGSLDASKLIYFCEFCPKQFVSKRAIRSHLASRKHSSDNLARLDGQALEDYLDARIYKRVVTCSVCEKDFISTQAAAQHERQAHNSGAEPNLSDTHPSSNGPPRDVSQLTRSAKDLTNQLGLLENSIEQLMLNTEALSRLQLDDREPTNRTDPLSEDSWDDDF